MKKYLTALYFLLLNPSLVFAQVVERFPKPDFESDYTRPILQSPVPRSQFIEFFDVFVLIAALSLASYFALKLRSRTKMFLLMIFSLIYFGFFRKGCICPVGSVQNVSLALFNSGYTIPLTVIAFFALPLVFTLFFGRTFCAAVCPLGAIQDAVIIKPTGVTPWIAQVLGILPYIYLGLAILFASTGAGFVICQYDPFIGFFRFGASFNMIVLGIFMLILGTVVARPYCRFLCPYGVLLNWMSRLSKWHVTISPSECINCRLCEESCPFGAINKPIEEAPVNRRKSITHLAVLFIILPIIVAGSGWVISRLHIPLSRQHFTVSLAEEIQLENSGRRPETTDETNAFRASGKTAEELFAEAQIIQLKFKTGGWILG
ncbi:MAG TPA: 4Fe-4S binding protein, partial [bacterium]|nr:4Fe-4S binding protein [bacterium]